MRVTVVDKQVKLVDKEPSFYDKSVGFFSGTFDPIHVGHLAMIERSLECLDEVWVQVHSFNTRKTPVSLDHRLQMVKFAIESIERAYIFNYASEQYKGRSQLISWLEGSIPKLRVHDLAGSDRVKSLLLRPGREVYLFKRGEGEGMATGFEGLSSSEIRQGIKKGDLDSALLPDKVREYIGHHRLYT